MDFGLFGTMPTSVLYIGVVLVMLIFCEIGYQFGQRVRSNTEDDAPPSLGPIVGGVLGMFAFLLAMTFSIAASQHNLRKAVVLDESNALGTAYLRADLLEEQRKLEVKKLLREYVDLRVDIVDEISHGVDADIDAVLRRSVEIHQLLWAQVTSAALKAPSANTSLMINAINSVIELHEKRVNAGVRNRIPFTLWIALSAISALTMITMGTQTGLTGKRGLVAVVPLSLAFAVLIVLIADLDRSQEGLIKVGQHSMVNVQARMDNDVR